MAVAMAMDALCNVLIMIATTILKTLLPLFGYPRFPEGVTGPHKLIGAHRLRIPDSAACQVFYPATPSSNPSSTSEPRRHPYFRAEAAEGVADWVKSDSRLFSFLNAAGHPCFVDALPKTPASAAAAADDSSVATFPVVIFSHGLGGTMEMYTELCRNVASHGFIVFAMEHEDGSASFAERVDGSRIYYKRPDDTPYSREKVLNFRGPMYDVRLAEVEGLLNYLCSYPNEIGGPNGVTGEAVLGEVFHKVMEQADVSHGVSLLGHSFGGSTIVHVQQCLEQRSAGTKQNMPPISSVAILDPWCFSLPDEALTAGITSTPLLAILSARWGTNSESSQVIQLLRNSKSAATVLWSPRAVHSSVSDTTGWLPRFVGRKMGMRGRKEGRHETVRAAAEKIAMFFQRDQVNQVTAALGESNQEEALNSSCGAVFRPFSIP